MTTPTRTRRLAALSLALVLTTAAGCGNDDSSSSGRSASDLADAGTSTSSTEGSSSGSTKDGDEEEPASAGSGSGSDGAIDATDFLNDVLAATEKKKRAHMTIDLGGTLTVEADVEYLAKGSAARLTMAANEQKISAVFVDGNFYLQQPGQKKYIKLSKDDPTAAALLGSFDGYGPRESLTQMQGAVTSVKRGGQKTFDGVKLTKFTVVVDTKKAAKAAGRPTNDAALPKTVTYVMYLDGFNLIRRLESEIQGQPIVLTVDKWGTAPKVTAPPASQVTTAAG